MDSTANVSQIQDHDRTAADYANIQRHLLVLGLEIDNDNLVIWHKHNAAHPRNWGTARKTFDVGLIILFDMTAYLRGQAIGAVIFPPYTESFGRKSLYIISTFLFALFCAITGAVVSLPSVIISRFFAGMLSAIPATVLVGSIEDMFDTAPRIWMVYGWSTTANLGLCIGPIMGAYVTAEVNWRWSFYITAIITGVLGCLMIAMRESRPSLLLSQRLDKLKSLTGDTSLRIRNPDHMPNARTFVQKALIRPLRLLVTEPIVMTVAIMTTLAFGLIYLFAAAMPIIYGSFGFDARHSSLSFIPIGLGLLLGIPVRFYDYRVFRRKRKQRKTIEPEEKIIGVVIAAPAFAVGLWWFAWIISSLVSRVHWMASMLSLISVGFVTNEFDCVLAGYVGDSYEIFSSFAFAAIGFVRLWSSIAVLFFGRQWFTNLKSNLGASILAVGATIFCICSVVFRLYGKKIKKASKFARYSVRIHNETRVDGYELEVEEPREASSSEL